MGFSFVKTVSVFSLDPARYRVSASSAVRAASSRSSRRAVVSSPVRWKYATSRAMHSQRISQPDNAVCLLCFHLFQFRTVDFHGDVPFPVNRFHSKQTGRGYAFLVSTACRFSASGEAEFPNGRSPAFFPHVPQIAVHASSCTGESCRRFCDCVTRFCVDGFIGFLSCNAFFVSGAQKPAAPRFLGPADLWVCNLRMGNGPAPHEMRRASVRNSIPAPETPPIPSAAGTGLYSHTSTFSDDDVSSVSFHCVKNCSNA